MKCPYHKTTYGSKEKTVFECDKKGVHLLNNRYYCDKHFEMASKFYTENPEFLDVNARGVK